MKISSPEEQIKLGKTVTESNQCFRFVNISGVGGSPSVDSYYTCCDSTSEVGQGPVTSLPSY